MSTARNPAAAETTTETSAETPTRPEPILGNAPEGAGSPWLPPQAKGEPKGGPMAGES